MSAKSNSKIRPSSPRSANVVTARHDAKSNFCEVCDITIDVSEQYQLYMYPPLPMSLYVRLFNNSDDIAYTFTKTTMGNVAGFHLFFVCEDCYDEYK